MINVPINAAETILEPFWDTGDSYPGHQKLSRLTPYRITYGLGAIAKVHDTWNGVRVEIEQQSEGTYAAELERDCEVNIGSYDVFRIFAAVPREIELEIHGVIDGEERLILQSQGNGATGEYDGSLSGTRLSRIRLRFRKDSETPLSAHLYWFGLANADRQAELEAMESPYNAAWEGCFRASSDLAPEAGLYTDAAELEALRHKLAQEPFCSVMAEIRSEAEQLLLSQPEREIGVYFPFPDRRFQRERDYTRADLARQMETVAFAGLIDGREDLLRMACRMALSAAHSTYWCESIMGVMPGVTWHHRSFTEYTVSRACATVLDWAGSLLTWHGRNIIMDAIIMKGLPRMEADFRTMDYIYDNNQGFMFNWGRVAALLVLVRRYPRYESAIVQAERDLEEMVASCVQPDGGILEGPVYWTAICQCLFPTLQLLARYRGKTLTEYAGATIRSLAAYGLTMLSDQGPGLRMLPVNDSPHSGSGALGINPFPVSMFAGLSEDPAWQRAYTQLDVASLGMNRVFFCLMAPERQAQSGPVVPDGLLTLEHTGQTSLWRTTPDLGRIHLHVTSGPVYFAHSHGDRGAFILEVGGTPILIDRGILTYNNAYGSEMRKSRSHNLLQPEAEGRMQYDQPAEDSIGGKVLQAKLQDGMFEYCTDTTAAWEPNVFERCTRSIHSDSSYVYRIRDTVRYVRPTASSFRLNTYGLVSRRGDRWIIREGNIEIAVIPENYTPVSDFCGPDLIGSQRDQHGEYREVNQLRLYMDRAEAHDLVTRIEISRVESEVVSAEEEAE
ncbi:heparinase II/III domain-containing protein [Paenibacillus daejeonensis]|uniref:heparinase II/III domain-containing protein n=1 Tax=Paenibacillus daejeonensis TaxID=135193 RepID=UPI00036727A1|nr:heparinase II/III family protein [Paenibacillus daejeonensis]